VPSAELPFVPHDGEPDATLDGGGDGLEWVRRVAAVAPRWLRPGGSLLVEVADDDSSASEVDALLRDAGFDVAAPAGRVRAGTSLSDAASD
jgi:release factor glutamine methyltransferase